LFTLKGMDVRRYDTATDFGPVARWVYRRDPVAFTSELTALRTSTWPADQVLLSVADCGGIVGAALQTRGAVLLVNGLPPAAAKTAAVALASSRSALPAVRGTPCTADAFSEAWREVAGVDAVTWLEETLYRLDVLNPPHDVGGAARSAEPDDAELLVEWLDAYFVEAFGVPSNPASSRDVLRDIDSAGGHIVLWTVNGVPVGMARVHAAAAGMSRVGPVYTSPENRGKGFGAALTAAAVRHAIRRGARDVVLFADDGNPVSNRIYRRLGFAPVGKNVQYAFTA
jgi:GNAT superfamily N-acetyltransferase